MKKSTQLFMCPYENISGLAKLLFPCWDGSIGVDGVLSFGLNI